MYVFDKCPKCNCPTCMVEWHDIAIIDDHPIAVKYAVPFLKNGNVPLYKMVDYLEKKYEKDDIPLVSMFMDDIDESLYDVSVFSELGPHCINCGESLFSDENNEKE